jgi:Uma2 family endonuclease
MELDRGRVVCMSPVGLEHGEIVGTVGGGLLSFTRARRLGSVSIGSGFKLAEDPDIVRAPDVSFVAADRRPKGAGRRRFVEGAPDLAVEVMSPDDREKDLLAKAGEYLDAGAARVWIVRPVTRSVTVFRAGGEVTSRHESATLTSEDAGFSADGFSLPVASIFAE